MTYPFKNISSFYSICWMSSNISSYLISKHQENDKFIVLSFAENCLCSGCPVNLAWKQNGCVPFSFLDHMVEIREMASFSLYKEELRMLISSFKLLWYLLSCSWRHQHVRLFLWLALVWRDLKFLKNKFLQEAI